MGERDRRRSPRYETQLEARLLFSVVLTGEPESGAGPRTLNLVGHTRDVSEAGLALVIPVAQIDEAFLAGADVTLRIELYLPGGAVEVTARPVRHHRFSAGEEQSIFQEGYFIGAEITRVSDRERFVAYLRTLAEV
ncbi:MAG TPA: PilZ domain-containing protein [Pyrinomonadaceae bacterium]|nr:PilZ domain-containing protein [Pyrinomonadaceae bacterium]